MRKKNNLEKKKKKERVKRRWDLAKRLEERRVEGKNRKKPGIEK